MGFSICLPFLATLDWSLEFESNYTHSSHFIGWSKEAFLSYLRIQLPHIPYFLVGIVERILMSVTFPKGVKNISTGTFSIHHDFKLLFLPASSSLE